MKNKTPDSYKSEKGVAEISHTEKSKEDTSNTQCIERHQTIFKDKCIRILLIIAVAATIWLIISTYKIVRLWGE